ncbi:MAG: endonuclease/exonuclease/phosphatase family protein [Myxococcota bacterium]
MTEPLRVLTANLLDDRADADALARTVEERRIDVLCVQELGARLAGAIAEVLPHGRLAPDRVRRGLGIACRREARVESIALPYRDGLAARLRPDAWSQLPETAEIACVHIRGPHTWPYFPAQAVRRGQMRGLLAHLDREPHLPRAVLGDFNASPLWPVYRRMARRLADAARPRPRPTWPHLPALGLRGLLRIDHCFVSGLQARLTRVVPLEGSDHLGLYVELVAQHAGTRTPRPGDPEAGRRRRGLRDGRRS